MIDELADIRHLDLPFNIDEVDHQCHECVRKQLKKYGKFINETGKFLGGKFLVPCAGIPKDPVDLSLKNTVDEETWETMQASVDVVKWAKKYLKLSNGEAWAARWYQAAVLKCTSRRKVLRISRRAGKCVSKNSNILTENGVFTAGDYFNLKTNRPRIVCFDQETHETKFSNAIIMDNGVKDLYKISTQNGREIDVTDNHPFLIKISETEAVWKELKDISIGDRIAVPSSYSHLLFSGQSVGVEKSRLLGYLAGDGGTSYKTTVRFSNKDQDILDDISNIVNKFGCRLNYIGGYDYNIVGDENNYGKFQCNQVNKMVTDNNLRCLSKNKQIPECILKGTEEDIVNFLGAYFDCDGWVSIKSKPDKGRNRLKGEIGIASASKKMMLQTKHLLLRLGIHSGLSHKLVKYKDGIKNAWQISFSNKDGIIKFYNKIKLKAKQDRLNKLYDLVKDRMSKSQNNEHYLWDKVKHIDYIGADQTYDLTVPGVQTLVADDIISHNTDAVCIEICYYLFTEPGQIILLAAPQKSQTEEVINRVRSFIHNNPELSKMVIRDVSAPYYEIKLSNGSRLRGFAAGTKGKGDGVGIRGQDASRVYLEEMDFIDENAINSAILPILQTSPNTTLVGFSTPSGFDTAYRKFCESNPYYIEYHYNYKVLPHWRNIEMERAQFTQEKWDHEFEALFGQSEKGVYKPTYIEKALKAYKYEDMSRSSNWKYCIGTDWNEKYGTEICVLGFNQFTSNFQLVEAIHIPKSEFTQLSGVQALLDMNKKWKPAFIYIDAGNGSSNYELLRKTAYDQRKPNGDRDTAKLLDILKKYDSGSAIVIKDPVTKQEKKTPAKPFMVDASLRMFEQYRITLSSADKKLQDQLHNYIIDRYTPTKVPVYGMEDEKIGDHRLDALNLAIVAFQLEFADLYTSQVSVSFGPAFMPNTQPTSRSVMVEEIKHEPTERRIDLGANSTDGIIRSIMPARIDNMRGTMKTSRAGWENDTEEQEAQKFLWRKRSRKNITRDVPTRTTF